jgi:regulator of cell morphogenesis and NO signaling
MTATATVGQLVAERPARARVFERFGIDYCCGGKKPLTQACHEKGVDVNAVMQELSQADARPSAEERDWSKASLTELADHIEATHHQYLKAELPRLASLTQKVASVHGQRHPELIEVFQIFAEFKQELDAHLMKEEQILFPMIRQLEASAEPVQFHCGSIQNPIRVMVMEHDSAGDALQRMRELTQDYAVPADACNTYRAMLDALTQLEADMHQHVHKENNILFPRAVEAEVRRGG